MLTVFIIGNNFLVCMDFQACLTVILWWQHWCRKMLHSKCHFHKSLCIVQQDIDAVLVSHIKCRENFETKHDLDHLYCRTSSDVGRMGQKPKTTDCFVIFSTKTSFKCGEKMVKLRSSFIVKLQMPHCPIFFWNI